MSVPVLPDTAPFTNAQRAWLNGFFAGYLGLGDGVTALSPEEGAALMAGVPALAREIYKDVKAEDAPKTVERMLKGYLAHRSAPEETFLAFSKRHEVAALTAMFDGVAVE